MITATATIVGLLLFAITQVLGHRRSGAAGRISAARAFILLWLVATLAIVLVGVLVRGYSLAQELPVFIIIFGIPAALAVLAIRRARRR